MRDPTESPWATVWIAVIIIASALVDAVVLSAMYGKR
jgi:hypothetical protein